MRNENNYLNFCSAFPVMFEDGVAESWTDSQPNDSDDSRE